MKPIGTHVEHLLVRRKQERAALRNRIAAAASATSFVQSDLPELSDVIPAEASPEQLAEHASWELRAAQARQRTCRRCPAEGGACDGATGYYQEGAQPVWMNGRIEQAECPKWKPYAERRLLRTSGVPPVFLDATFEQYRPATPALAAAAAAVRTYAQSVAGGATDSAVLAGDTGLGKTHLAVAALRLVSCVRPSVLFAYVPELVELLRLEARGQIGPSAMARSAGLFERAASAELLVLDDLGAERPTDFAREKLEHLVNRRWTERRPMIVTQNVSAESLEDLLGAPLVRRIESAASVYVPFAYEKGSE